MRLEEGSSRGGGVMWAIIALILVLFGMVAFNGGATVLRIHAGNHFDLEADTSKH